jgi:hypothetical protein
VGWGGLGVVVGACQCCWQEYDGGQQVGVCVCVGGVFCRARGVGGGMWDAGG